jgi:hypothetical protein
MIRKLILVVAAFVLFFPASVGAHTSSPAHYAGDCTGGSPTKHGQYYVSVGTNDGGAHSFKSVRADASIHAMIPCTNPVAGNGGWSLVNVVNARRYTTFGAFVQFGYAAQACYPGYCQDHFVNRRLDFWFTKDDLAGGLIYTADWVDNLDGNTADHDFPVPGDRYEWTISETSVSGVAKWRYCISVLSSSLYATGNSDCHNEDRDSASGFDEASYTVELYNNASQLGTQSGGAGLDISPMQYLNSNGSIYTTITGEDTDCFWTGVDDATGNPYYAALSTGCSETTTTGVISHFNAWTYFHTAQ